MSTVTLADLQLFTPEQAAEVMSGDTEDAVSGYWIREGIRDGRFDYTKVGRRIMLSRPQVAAIIAACRVEPKARASRRASTA